MATRILQLATPIDVKNASCFPVLKKKIPEIIATSTVRHEMKNTVFSLSGFPVCGVSHQACLLRLHRSAEQSGYQYQDGQRKYCDASDSRHA
jgi:hypothetical protein